MSEIFLNRASASFRKAIYLKQNNGLELKDITREATDDSCLYIFGPGFFSDLKKEAAWELFEQFHPEAYKLVESWTIPGLDFDEEQFLNSFSTLELKTKENKGYVVIDTE